MAGHFVSVSSGLSLQCGIRISIFQESGHIRSCASRRVFERSGWRVPARPSRTSRVPEVEQRPAMVSGLSHFHQASRLELRVRPSPAASSAVAAVCHFGSETPRPAGDRIVPVAIQDQPLAFSKIGLGLSGSFSRTSMAF